MDRDIILIGNPIAGGNAMKKIEKSVKIIKDRGFNVRLMLTGKKGDAELFAREISRNQSRNPTPPQPPLSKGVLIIAAGGDGTYNEVINGIACTDIPMAILSLGTTNVLARELNIPEDIDKALDIALSGRIQTVCLGRITARCQASGVKCQEFKMHDTRFRIQDSHASGIVHHASEDSSLITRHFLLMAGIGYDGETVYGISNKIKKYSGKGAYIWSGLKTLLSWNPDKLTFNIDGKLCEGYSAIVCNASKYAGNFKVAPDASLKDPLLYAFIMHGRRRLDIIRYVSGIITKRHLWFRDITYQQAEKIEIKGNAHIQIDGDYLGRTPAKIEVVPDALRLVY